MASDILDVEGPVIFVAVYRPYEGKDAEFRKILKEHEPTLRRLGLITGRPTIIMQARDGSYIEIAEWIQADASRLAHEHPEVAATWEAMGKIADFPGLIGLEEAKMQFANFRPVGL